MTVYGVDLPALIAALLAVIIWVAMSVLVVSGKPVPELLSNLAFGVFGFYFGHDRGHGGGHGNGRSGSAGHSGGVPVREVVREEERHERQEQRAPVIRGERAKAGAVAVG